VFNNLNGNCTFVNSEKIKQWWSLTFMKNINYKCLKVTREPFGTKRSEGKVTMYVNRIGKTRKAYRIVVVKPL
jgi:hypothetical protein